MKKFLFLLLLLLSVSVLFASCAEEEIFIGEIRLSQTEYEFDDVGQSLQLVASLLPENVTERSVVWTSSNENVATVTSYGKVESVGDGNAIIIVQSKKSSVSAMCNIRVKTAVPVTGITLAETSHLFSAFGESCRITASVSPEDATNQYILWSSSDPNVVAVDANGIVTSVSNGTAIITAVTEEGGFSAFCECTVYVDTNVPMEDVNFDISEYTFTSIDENLILTPVFTPENTTERGLIWSVSDTGVASVDPLTGTVTPKSNGTATVYAVADNKKKQAICKITVDAVIPAEGIRLSEESVTFDEKGAEYQIKYELLPKNTTENNVVFVSENPAAASVSSSGLVTAMSNGTADIRVMTAGGTVEATFRVTVQIPENVPVSGVEFTDKTYTFAKLGDTLSLDYIVTPSGAKNKAVTFTSSDPDKISVDQNGKITAKSEGSSVITVKTADGGFTDNFFAIVTLPKPEEIPTPILPENTLASTVSTASDGMVGMWVSTVWNIDFPSDTGLSASKMKNEIDKIVENAASWGINTIFLQVRPMSDAIYPSDIFPSSNAIVKNQGDELPLDCLEYFIAAAHAKGIELHAWINPYRIRSSGMKVTLADTNPAVLHPEWTVEHEGTLYYNPGIPEVRQLIVDGVMEIVRNYNVDGIHFDDYFYPYDNADKFKDDAEYQKYKSEGQTKAEWRRQNNDQLIETVYKTIKAYDPDMTFGVSPAAVWALKSNNSLGTDVKSSAETYYQIYADTRKWVLNGWLDYICPQVYFQISHATAPFKPIVDWWDELVSATNVRLYIGIAAYKGVDVTAYKSSSEITNQLAYLKTKDHVDGAAFFSYVDLKNNVAGVHDTIRTYVSAQTHKLLPAASDVLVMSEKKRTVSSESTKAYILGVSDPNYPLYVNGKEVTTRSATGYFSYVVTDLDYGDNHVTIKHKYDTLDYIITRRTESKEPTTMSEFGFITSTCAPKYDYADVSGKEVKFCCTATAGAKVTVRLGDYTFELKTTDRDSTDGSFKRAWYEGYFTLPEVEGNLTLGSPVFTIEKDGFETVTHKGTNTFDVINDPSAYTVQISEYEPWLKTDRSLTNEDSYVAAQGAIDTVVSKYDNFTKLGSGYYIENKNITKTDSPIAYSSVGKITVTQSTDGKTTNINIPCDEKMMNAIRMEDSCANIFLYNLASLPTEISLPENPLFADATVTKIDNKTVKISLKYKKELYIYGFTTYFEDGKLVVAFKNPIRLYDSETYPLYNIKISVDPGHSLGGGACGPWGFDKLDEEEFNYTLSQLVEKKLIALGATVRLSHHREQEKDIDELIPEFRAWNPDLHISIHFNDVDESTDPLVLSGTVSYYAFSCSKLFSQTMLDSFTEYTGLKKNKSKISHFLVALITECPSILFETASISNYNDYEWFVTEGNMEKAADGIVQGILDYFRLQANTD